MDKSTGAAVAGGLLQLVPRVGGLRLQLVTPSSCEVNEKTCSSFRVGNFTEAQTIQTLARQRWPNTFRLDCRVLGQPIGTVTRQHTWEQYLGRPMEQPVPGTCALVACTACVEAAHRFKHRTKVHGEATVPCYKLIRVCFLDGIWTPGKGANVGKVLAKIQEMGGLPAITNAPTPAPCVLPLRSWKEHSLWDSNDGSVAGRLHDSLAELLERHGPCVGVLWVCPWYHRFDAGADDTLVYRGCGRNDGDRRMSEQLYRGQVGWHAVVCFAYRFCGDQMHVLVLDNHSATGPRRWIDCEEFHTLYTLSSV